MLVDQVTAKELPRFNLIDALELTMLIARKIPDGILVSQLARWREDVLEDRRQQEHLHRRAG